MNSLFSIDSRGLRFAAKFAVIVVLSFTGVQYGTVFAVHRVEVASNQEIVAINEEMREAEEMRKMRSYGALVLLQKMQEYKHTLSTRTITGTSFNVLSAGEGKWIGVDLSAMKMYLYENGFPVATYEILSKGKRGSRWETPTGLYKIETKEKDHFSSIGEVHMPYSMQFFGNFFIHGWPYYPDGTPVAEGFSGGCIRLGTDDAQNIFQFADRSTPIFVWNGDVPASISIVVEDKPLPKISAKAFLVADMSSGRVFAERNADEVYPIASLTKLLTALVANETIHFDHTISVTKDDRAQAEGTPGSIAPNDSFTAGNLIFPLLLESNNSVAYALARYYGTSNFIRWMNDKAKAIGMSHTTIEDPSGISDHNIASVNDLFVLTKYIHDSQSFIFNTTREKGRTIKSIEGKRYALGNFNVFADDPTFLGGKTGYTGEAHETMTAVFKVNVENAPVPQGSALATGQASTTVAIIVLGSDDRKKDVQKLLAWFKSAAIVEKENN